MAVTREQVVQWGETQYSPKFMKMNIKYMTALYALARADLEAENAEQHESIDCLTAMNHNFEVRNNILALKLAEATETIAEQAKEIDRLKEDVAHWRYQADEAVKRSCGSLFRSFQS